MISYGNSKPCLIYNKKFIENEKLLNMFNISALYNLTFIINNAFKNNLKNHGFPDRFK